MNEFMTEGVHEYIDVANVSRETLENAFHVMAEVAQALNEELKNLRVQLEDERAVRSVQTHMLARLR